MLGRRASGIDKPVRQQWDVEHIGAVSFLCRGQNIEQQRDNAPIV